MMRLNKKGEEDALEVSTLVKMILVIIVALVLFFVWRVILPLIFPKT